MNEVVLQAPPVIRGAVCGLRVTAPPGVDLGEAGISFLAESLREACEGDLWPLVIAVEGDLELEWITEAERVH